MLTIDIQKASALIEDGSYTQEDVESFVFLLRSMDPVMREIDRAETMHTTTKQYPPGYVQRGLPELLESSIDQIIDSHAVAATFYHFLQEIMTTDVFVLNTLIFRKTRQ